MLGQAVRLRRSHVARRVTAAGGPSSPRGDRTARSPRPRPRAGAGARRAATGRSGRRRSSSIARSHQAWTGLMPAKRSVSARAQQTPSCSSTVSLAYIPTTTTRPPRRTTSTALSNAAGVPDGLDHDVRAAAVRCARRAPSAGCRSRDVDRRRRPRARASASRSGSRSSARTRAAPRARAACTQKKPTGPAPDHGDRVARARSRRRGRVDAGREDVADEERALVLEPVRDRAGGSTSATGTRSSSACAPARPPPNDPGAEVAEVLAELRLPAPAEPARAARDVERDDHPVARREPRRRPGRRPRPRRRPRGRCVSPGSSGALPWKKWRSEPQIAESVTRTIASSGSSTTGSGTSATTTRPTSSKTTARTRLRPRRGTRSRRCRSVAADAQPLDREIRHQRDLPA